MGYLKQHRVVNKIQLEVQENNQLFFLDYLLHKQYGPLRLSTENPPTPANICTIEYRNDELNNITETLMKNEYPRKILRIVRETRDITSEQP